MWKPLNSVARLSEAGNAVILGVGGGMIRNLASGADTPFVRKDGVYVFTLCIPPADVVSEAVSGPGFTRQA